MTKLLLARTTQMALAPYDAAAADFIAKLKVGQPVYSEITRARNARFHRKVMSLFRLAFDHWDTEPQTYRGQEVERSFDRFRGDLTILAGFYRPVTNIRGEIRLEPESISYANMDEERFEKVYHALLNTIWKQVMKRHASSPDDLDRLVSMLMAYD